MATEEQKQQALNDIQRNISQFGHHIYVVSGVTEPRFAYTIGNSQSFGSELILAGAILFMKDDVLRIIKEIAAKLRTLDQSDQVTFDVEECGSFSLRKVDPSWSKELMLGALDFYQVKEITVSQIVPDDDHWTIDVPDMSQPLIFSTAIAWKWLCQPWAYSVPEKSTVITDLAALRGERITEATRWEEDEWEIFAGAGPDIPKDEIRIVPLETLLASDESLHPVLDLPIGEGFYRNEDSDWHPWRKSEETETS